MLFRKFSCKVRNKENIHMLFGDENHEIGDAIFVQNALRLRLRFCVFALRFCVFALRLCVRALHFCVFELQA